MPLARTTLVLCVMYLALATGGCAPVDPATATTTTTSCITLAQCDLYSG